MSRRKKEIEEEDEEPTGDDLTQEPEEIEEDDPADTMKELRAMFEAQQARIAELEEKLTQAAPTPAPAPAQHFPPAGPEVGRVTTDLSKVQTQPFSTQPGAAGEVLYLPEQFNYQGKPLGPGNVTIDTSTEQGRVMHGHLTAQVARAAKRNEERAAILKREGISAAPPVPIHEPITDPAIIESMTEREPDRSAGSGGP